MPDKMPRKPRYKLPVLNLGNESMGKRIARLRKERGYTQVELAEKIGITQKLISDYERDKLRLHSEMVLHFSLALEVSADELLGVKKSKKDRAKPSLRLLRRLQKISELSQTQQRALLQTIDTFLKGAGK